MSREKARWLKANAASAVKRQFASL